MSILIKNATIWEWGEGDISPHGSSYKIVPKKWLSVSKEGKFKIPTGIEADRELTLTEEASYDTCVDASGRLLLPGLIDSHIHTSMTGESVHFVDLKDCRSIDQLVFALEVHMSKHTGLSWIIGVNWDQVIFVKLIFFLFTFILSLFPSIVFLDKCIIHFYE